MIKCQKSCVCVLITRQINIFLSGPYQITSLVLEAKGRPTKDRWATSIYISELQCKSCKRLKEPTAQFEVASSPCVQAECTRIDVGEQGRTPCSACQSQVQIRANPRWSSLHCLKSQGQPSTMKTLLHDLALSAQRSAAYKDHVDGVHVQEIDLIYPEHYLREKCVACALLVARSTGAGL